MDLDMSDLFEEYGYEKGEGVKEIEKVSEKKKQIPPKKEIKQKTYTPSEIAGEMAQNYYNRAEFWRDRYAFFIGKPWRTDAETLYKNFIPIIQLTQEIFGNLSKAEREDREFTLNLIKQIKKSIGGE